MAGNPLAACLFWPETKFCIECGKSDPSPVEIQPGVRDAAIAVYQIDRG